MTENKSYEIINSNSFSFGEVTLIDSCPNYCHLHHPRDEAIEHTYHICVCFTNGLGYIIGSLEQMKNMSFHQKTDYGICKGCGSKGDCSYVKSITIPGLSFNGLDLLETEVIHKYEERQIGLCSDCFAEVTTEISTIIDENSSTIVSNSV